MSFDVVIRGGRVASSAGVERADVAIVGERVAAVGDLSEAVATSEVDAAGLIVMPGVIDTQVHFREPGLEHKEDLESGTRAALNGGVTTIFEMPNTQPPTVTREALADKLRRAQGRAWCDFAFFVGASPENAEELVGLENLPGTPGVKIFMGSSTGSLLVDHEADLRRVLSSGRRPCPVHSEDEERNRQRKALLSESPHPREHPFLRDAESAVISTERLIRLCRETGRPVHILHISTADELPLIRRAKEEGLPVTAEVTPQHLWFAADAYERLGSLVQMNPPVREEHHRQALWEAVEEGLFDVFGSDHAPHTLEEKARPYPESPSGMPGVQTLLPVLLTFARQGRLTVPQIVRMACERPAELYGISRKGRIAEGYDADLVLIDPEAEAVFSREEVQSKCGWSPYEGEALAARPWGVWLRGQRAIHDGERLGSPSGRMVEFDWKA
jgi:dihydroorotase